MALSSDFITEAKRWIAFPTVTTASNRRFIEYLAGRFRRLGFWTRAQNVAENGARFSNLIAWKGPRGRPPLLLNTHTDTVPPGPLHLWTKNRGKPWRAVVAGGRLFGLGAADVKLNLLCQWKALQKFSKAKFRRPLCVAATFGEERGCRGARELARAWRGPKPALALVGEPSLLRLVNEHRGYLVFEWNSPSERPLRGAARGFDFWRADVQGKSAHSSTPHLGDNAIVRGFNWLKKIPSAALLAAEGGTAANQVPAAASFWICVQPGARLPADKQVRARRVRPERFWPAGQNLWEPFAAAVGALERAFTKKYSTNLGIIRTTGKGLKILFDVRYPPGVSSRTVIAKVKKIIGNRGPLRIERDNPPLKTRPRGAAWPALRSALKASRLSPRFDQKPTCTEAGIYHEWGVPAFVFGPGRSVGNVHKPNESIELAQLERATAFYENLIAEWTGAR